MTTTKLHETKHGDNCNGLACECPSKGSLLAEYAEELNALLTSGDDSIFPPWTTREEAIRETIASMARIAAE